MSWIVPTLIALVGLALSAFFSGSETGIYCVSRLRVHLGVQKRDAAHLRIAHLLEDEPSALTVTLIGTNVMNYLTTAAVAYLFAEFMSVSKLRTELYTIALLTPIMFVFGEVVPKTLFQRHADLLMVGGSALLMWFNRLFRLTGVVWVFVQLSAWINRWTTGRSLREIKTLAPQRRVARLLQEALADRAMGDAQSELIDQVCRLSETPLHSVMVPRNHITHVSPEVNRSELLKIARRRNHARLPVLQRNRRRVLGMIDVDALLQDRNWKEVGDRLEPMFTLSPHDTVASALTRMRSSGCRMAAVTDRNGLMLGLVTLTDLSEEVIGELAEDN